MNLIEKISVLLVIIGLLFLSASLALFNNSLVKISPRYLTFLQDEDKFVSQFQFKVVNHKVIISRLCIFLYLLFLVSALYLSLFFLSNFQLSWYFFVLLILVITLILMLFFSIFLKEFAAKNFEKITRNFSFVIWFLYKILKPLAILLNNLANIFITPTNTNDEVQVFEAKLLDMVDEANQEGVMDSDEQDMITSIVELDNTLAKDVMVPRNLVVAVDVATSIRQVISTAVKSGHSRIPVFEESLDNPVGIVYLKDIVTKQFLENNSDFSLVDVLREPVFMPITKRLSIILKEMQINHNHMVLLIDEYGGLAGLLTIEDILEEIVGEIVDEYDFSEIEPVTQLAPNLFRVSSRLSINDLNKLFDTRIEEESVDTVGGLLGLALERVPVPGVKVKTHGLLLLAEGGQGTKNKEQITTILVSKCAEEQSVADWNPLNV